MTHALDQIQEILEHLKSYCDVQIVSISRYLSTRRAEWWLGCIDPVLRRMTINSLPRSSEASSSSEFSFEASHALYRRIQRPLIHLLCFSWQTSFARTFVLTEQGRRTLLSKGESSGRGTFVGDVGQLWVARSKLFSRVQVEWRLASEREEDLGSIFYLFLLLLWV